MNEIFVGTRVQNTTTPSPTKTKEKWESTQLFRVGRFMFVGPGSKDIWHYNQHGRHELEGLLDSRAPDVIKVFRQKPSPRDL